METVAFNAGLISVAFALLFAGIYFAGKRKNIENATEKEPYACGEALKPESSGEGMLYAALYKALGLKNLERLHDEGLNEYLSWMLVAVAIAVALFAVFGA